MALEAVRFQMPNDGFRDFTSTTHWVATMLDDTETRDHTISDNKKGMKAAYDAGYVDGEEQRWMGRSAKLVDELKRGDFTRGGGDTWQAGYDAGFDKGYDEGVADTKAFDEAAIAVKHQDAQVIQSAGPGR